MAIALDTSSASTAGSGTSVSWSHTCTGSNRLLVVGISGYNGGGPPGPVTTGVTYGGQAMTKIDSMAPQNSVDLSLWYLVNPPSGSNTVQATMGSALGNSGTAVSYTGVKQTSPLDASTKNANNLIGTTWSLALTTTTDNCWVVGITATGAGSQSSTGGGTIRQSFASPTGKLADNNGPKTPAGTVTFSWSNANDSYGSIMASFKPDVPAGGNAMFMGANF